MHKILMYASLSIESSKIITGTQALLNDASKAILIIAPILAAVFIGYCASRKMTADEHEAPAWHKRIVGIVIALIIVVSASGIISLVTAYYQ